jgi:hypothetical protein
VPRKVAGKIKRGAKGRNVSGRIVVKVLGVVESSRKLQPENGLYLFDKKIKALEEICSKSTQVLVPLCSHGTHTGAHARAFLCFFILSTGYKFPRLHSTVFHTTISQSISMTFF